MNELAVWLPPQFSIEQSKRIVGSMVRGEFVEYVADFCRSFRDGGNALPNVPVEPLRLCGDDEHVWIGLVP